MTSDKAKPTPPNRLQRIRDEALFIRRFQYVSDLSPDDLRQQLQALAYQHSKLTSVFFPRRRSVSIQAIDDQHHTFEIKTRLGGLYTELSASGYIYQDTATGKTTLSGAVKFDALYLTVLIVGLFFLITWGLASLSQTGSLASPFIMFTLGLTNLFYFRQMFLDRNTLLNTLADTCTISDLASARKRLSVARSIPPDNLANATELNPHQQQARSQETP